MLMSHVKSCCTYMYLLHITVQMSQLSSIKKFVFGTRAPLIHTGNLDDHSFCGICMKQLCAVQALLLSISVCH